MDKAQIEQLVDRITRELIAQIQSGSGVSCVTGPGGLCVLCGGCVEKVPGKVDAIVDAGAERISSGLGYAPRGGSVAAMIDHTLLKPDVKREQILQLCKEAKEYRFISVCVNPCWVELCARELSGTSVKVCSVIGFPLGTTMPEVKAYEAQRSILAGATELDMVLNIGALKGQEYELVERDVTMVVQACRSAGALCKVIIETALLDDTEKVEACVISKEAGADFVKTSTGFSKGGATVEDVALMRKTVGPQIGVKASGGVSDYGDLQKMVDAGATRIGASAGIKIVKAAIGQPN